MQIRSMVDSDDDSEELISDDDNEFSLQRYLNVSYFFAFFLLS